MKKSKILLSSILTIMLCVSLIAGATLALFTSESSVSIAITSGKVDVVATVKEGSLNGLVYTEGEDEPEVTPGEGNSVTFSTAQATITEEGGITVSNIAPGYGVKFQIEVTNKSNVASKFRTAIGFDEDQADEKAENLFKKLDFQVGKSGSEPSALLTSMDGTRYSKWSEIIGKATAEEGDVVETLDVEIVLPLDAGNEYKDIEDCKFSVVVEAVQSNAKTEDVTGINNIFTASDFKALASLVNSGEFKGTDVYLMKDVDLGGDTEGIMRVAYSLMSASEWTPIGTDAHPFTAKFHGNGYTITNLSATGERAALFGVTENAAIDDLVIGKAKVTATGENGCAGVLVGEARGSLTVSNITVENCLASHENENDKNVGALVGMMTADSAGEEPSLSVENINVTTSDSEADLNSGNNSSLVGGESAPEIEYKGENELDYLIAEGFVKSLVKNGSEQITVVYKVLSANGLKAFRDIVNAGNSFKGETVYLYDNINLNNNEWTPIGKKTSGDGSFAGTFDGQGYTIENLKVVGGIVNEGPNNCHGLFGYAISPAVIKNFTLKNVNVSGAISVGAVVGDTGNGATVQDVNVEGNINIVGDWYVGGIVGYGYGSVKNCKVIGNTHSEIIFAGAYVGGVAGWRGEGASGQISGCEVKNIVIRSEHMDGASYDDECPESRVGGISGIAHYGNTISGNTLSNVTLDLSKSNNAWALGAIAGTYHVSRNKDDDKVTNKATISDNSGDVKIIAPATAVMYNDGITGDVWHSESKNRGIITLSNNNVDIKWNGFIVSGKNHFAVDNAESLMAFGKACLDGTIRGGEGLGLTLTLLDDIDMKGYEWTPIYMAHGTFDGNGKILSNVTCLADSLGKSALLAGYGCTIKNLTVDNFTASGAQAAVFVANAQGGANIQDCTLKGDIVIKHDAEIYPEETARSIGLLLGVYQGEKGFENITIAGDCKVLFKGLESMTTVLTIKSKNLYFGYCGGNAPSEDLINAIKVEEGASIVAAIEVGNTTYAPAKNSLSYSTVDFDGDIVVEGVDVKSSIIEGNLMLKATGKVTVKNVKLTARHKGQWGNGFDYALNVTAPEFYMSNCEVRRLDGNACYFGTLMEIHGNATIDSTVFVSPFTGDKNAIANTGSSIINQAEGKLTMNDSVVSTNGFGFFSSYISNAEFNNVTFCGLEDYYDGDDCEVTSLYMAINSTNMEDIKLDNCTVKDARSWGILAAGNKFDMQNCTFENDNSYAVCFSYGSIENAIIKNNTFNVLDGKKVIAFDESSLKSSSAIEVSGNKYIGNADKFDSSVYFYAKADSADEKSGDLGNILSVLNNKSNVIDQNAIISLGEGMFGATANEQFKLTANGVSIIGAGETTIIDAGNFSCSAQAGFEVSGDNCSIQNVKIVSSFSDNKNVSALKITKLDNEFDIVENFILKNVVIEGNKSHGLNLHGVNNVVVDGVKIAMFGKAGISMAKATDVKLSNVTIDKQQSAWADIGFMYANAKTEDGSEIVGTPADAYETPCDVSIDFASCSFGMGRIYSERTAGGMDVIRNGADAIEAEGTVVTADEATWTMTVSGNVWALTRNA